MKLSILVEYLEQLDSVLDKNPQPSVDTYLKALTSVVCQHSVVRYENHATILSTAADDIHNLLNGLHSTVGYLKQDIKRDIDRIHTYYLTSSLNRYMQHETKQSSELSVLNRRPILSDHAQEKLTSRIRILQDWTYPGLIVRPGNSCWLDDFRTDPIYVLDHTQEQIDQAIGHLPQLVQQRLCRYIICETPKLCITPCLPGAQFGVSLIYFYFNFRPIEIITQWLDELWRVTRDGGRVLFTYNDCDKSHGIQLFESRYMSFTPGHMIRDYATNLGFVIIDDCYLSNDISVMELEKPGQRITQRAAQCLARVLARPK